MGESRQLTYPREAARGGTMWELSLSTCSVLPSNIHHLQNTNPKVCDHELQDNDHKALAPGMGVF